jgi:hypothetical protein
VVTQELGADGGCADPLPLVPSACHRDQQVTGVEPGTSCLQIADHQFVWFCTVLGLRFLSGLLYPSMDRANGTAVVRECQVGGRQDFRAQQWENIRRE